MEDLTGTVLAGRFRVLSTLGSGGMATVYKVSHLQLGGLSALKLMNQPQPSMSMRMLQEGRIQAQIRHPNLIPVTDIIEHEGRIGLVMEFVPGPSLMDRITEAPRRDGQNTGRIPLEEALLLFAGVLAGITAVHAAGISHRDLKPSNILLSGDPPTARVVDFGIARLLSPDPEHGHTQHGASMGTPGYMAPEQTLDASQASARADIFSLAVILYEMLTGRCPLSRNAELSRMEVYDRLISPLSQMSVDCPPHISAAVEQAMSWDPRDRPASCLKFAALLFTAHPQLLERVHRLTPTRADPHTASSPDDSRIRLPRLQPAPRQEVMLASIRAADRANRLQNIPPLSQLLTIAVMSSLVTVLIWLLA